MTLSVLFIGDPHIKISNLVEVDIFMKRLVATVNARKPDIIIIAGDLLHTHERLHTMALNKACDLVNKMRLSARTYVLVGNHDYIQNQQFLTTNHWMNGLKEWKNTVIVDKVLEETISGEKFILVPYVPPGRFTEALDTLPGTWRDASCIFAHQEFEGCKMGAIVSTEGDKWPVTNPDVISGHIHARQRPQTNIYYPGSAMQHAFGESEKNIIALLTFKNQKYHSEEIDLKLPRKKIIYMDVGDIDSYVTPNTTDKFKLTLKGNYEEFKAVKKTKKYKRLIKDGVKIIFKPEKKAKTKYNTNVNIDFLATLRRLVYEQKDPQLQNLYELIINT